MVDRPAKLKKNPHGPPAQNSTIAVKREKTDPYHCRSLRGLLPLFLSSRFSSRFVVAMAVNGTFVSPTADAKIAHRIAQLPATGLLSTLLENVNGWTLVLTVFLMLIAYDQCRSKHTMAIPLCHS
jgi:hypothetical protein